MARENFNDLHAFVLVAREGSFTRAAAQLRISQSALSHTIRGLETRLGIRLLTRTTRSVSPTEAGQRLLQTLSSRFEEIEAELAALSELRDKPAGTVRITAAHHAARTVLWPKLAKLLPHYPDIKVEVVTESRFVDLAAERFDMGVRLGDQVEKDMVAVRISSDLRMAIVATPAYFAARSLPQTPHDLAGHNCINLRLATLGGIYAWEFEKDGQPLKVHVEGQLVFSDSVPMLQAALEGFGVACVPEDMVDAHIAQDRLVRVLEEWCPYFQGYHLYFPRRRQSLPALALVVDALRHRPATEDLLTV